MLQPYGFKPLTSTNGEELHQEIIVLQENLDKNLKYKTLLKKIIIKKITTELTRILQSLLDKPFNAYHLKFPKNLRAGLFNLNQRLLCYAPKTKIQMASNSMEFAKPFIESATQIDYYNSIINDLYKMLLKINLTQDHDKYFKPSSISNSPWFLSGLLKDPVDTLYKTIKIIENIYKLYKGIQINDLLEAIVFSTPCFINLYDSYPDFIPRVLDSAHLNATQQISLLTLCYKKAETRRLLIRVAERIFLDSKPTPAIIDTYISLLSTDSDIPIGNICKVLYAIQHILDNDADNLSLTESISKLLIKMQKDPQRLIRLFDQTHQINDKQFLLFKICLLSISGEDNIMQTCDDFKPKRNLRALFLGLQHTERFESLLDCFNAPPYPKLPMLYNFFRAESIYEQRKLPGEFLEDPWGMRSRISKAMKSRLHKGTTKEKVKSIIDHAAPQRTGLKTYMQDKRVRELYDWVLFFRECSEGWRGVNIQKIKVSILTLRKDLQNPVNRFERSRLLIQLIAAISEYVYYHTGLYVRDTQLLAIILNTMNDESALSQINTGEGKSLTVVISAICQCLIAPRKTKIIILTATQADAMRNYQIFSYCFTSLLDRQTKIINSDTPLDDYQNTFIFFSSLEPFTLFDLRLQNQGLGKHNRIIYLDEADIILDYPQNCKLTTNLDSSRSEHNPYENIYPLIIEFVDQEHFLTQKCSRMADIQQLQNHLSELLTTNVHITHQQKKSITGLLNAGDKRIDQMIDAALNSLHLIEDTHFTLPEQQSIENGVCKNIYRAVPLSNGRMMHGSIFSNEVHQFLLTRIKSKYPKRTIPIPSVKSPILTATVIEMLRTAQKIYGLTGTVGDSLETSDLISLFHFKRVLSFPKYVTTHVEVTHQIHKSGSHITRLCYLALKHNGPTLIHCESIADVESVAKTLYHANQIKRTQKKIQAFTAKSAQLESTVIDQAGLPQSITISNILGRGTDIKPLDPKLPLLVLMSVIPGPRDINNHNYSRQERQIMGRTGRNQRDGIVIYCLEKGHENTTCKPATTQSAYIELVNIYGSIKNFYQAQALRIKLLLIENFGSCFDNLRLILDAHQSELIITLEQQEAKLPCAFTNSILTNQFIDAAHQAFFHFIDEIKTCLLESPSHHPIDPIDIDDLLPNETMRYQARTSLLISSYASYAPQFLHFNYFNQLKLRNQRQEWGVIFNQAISMYAAKINKSPERQSATLIGYFKLSLDKIYECYAQFPAQHALFDEQSRLERICPNIAAHLENQQNMINYIRQHMSNPEPLLIDIGNQFAQHLWSHLIDHTSYFILFNRYLDLISRQPYPHEISPQKYIYSIVQKISDENLQRQYNSLIITAKTQLSAYNSHFWLQYDRTLRARTLIHFFDTLVNTQSLQEKKNSIIQIPGILLTQITNIILYDFTINQNRKYLAYLSRWGSRLVAKLHQLFFLSLRLSMATAQEEEMNGLLKFFDSLFVNLCTCVSNYGALDRISSHPVISNILGVANEIIPYMRRLALDEITDKYALLLKFHFFGIQLSKELAGLNSDFSSFYFVCNKVLSIIDTTEECKALYSTSPHTVNAYNHYTFAKELLSYTTGNSSITDIPFHCQLNLLQSAMLPANSMLSPDKSLSEQSHIYAITLSLTLNYFGIENCSLHFPRHCTSITATQSMPKDKVLSRNGRFKASSSASSQSPASTYRPTDEFSPCHAQAYIHCIHPNTGQMQFTLCKGDFINRISIHGLNGKHPLQIEVSCPDLKTTLPRFRLQDQRSSRDKAF